MRLLIGSGIDHDVALSFAARAGAQDLVTEFMAGSPPTEQTLQLSPKTVLSFNASFCTAFPVLPVSVLPVSILTAAQSHDFVENASSERFDICCR